LVLDEVAALDFADIHSGTGIERVVGQFLEHQPAQPALGHTGFLLQPLDGAEAGPVGALEFQILRRL
jgi:hypothetical protein